MDELVARKLSRQLKLLNFLLVFFTLVIVAVFAVTGIIAYKAVQEVRSTKNSLDSLQNKAEQNLNFKSDLCSSSGSVSTLLKKQSDVCN